MIFGCKVRINDDGRNAVLFGKPDKLGSKENLKIIGCFLTNSKLKSIQKIENQYKKYINNKFFGYTQNCTEQNAYFAWIENIQPAVIDLMDDCRVLEIDYDDDVANHNLNYIPVCNNVDSCCFQYTTSSSVKSTSLNTIQSIKRMYLILIN